VKCFAHKSSGLRATLPGCRAFTFTELIIASTVFLMAVGGVLIANSVGMQMMSLTQPKLAVTGRTRNTVAQLYSDISSAKFVRVGNGNLTGFTNIAVPNPKEGNAIELYTTNDTTLFVRYFRDAADKKLKRMTSSATNATVVANAISNSIVFRAEDLSGNVQTNEEINMVVAIRLQYYQLDGSGTLVGGYNYLDGSGTPVGAGSYYKSFTLTNRIAHRAR